MLTSSKENIRRLHNAYSKFSASGETPVICVLLLLMC